MIGPSNFSCARSRMHNYTITISNSCLSSIFVLVFNNERNNPYLQDTELRKQTGHVDWNSEIDMNQFSDQFLRKCTQTCQITSRMNITKYRCTFRHEEIVQPPILKNYSLVIRVVKQTWCSKHNRKPWVEHITAHQIIKVRNHRECKRWNNHHSHTMYNVITEIFAS